MNFDNSSGSEPYELGLKPVVVRAAHRPHWTVFLLISMLLADMLMLALYFISLKYASEPVIRLFHVNIEKNIPSTYSALKLLLAGVVACSCAGLAGDKRISRVASRNVWMAVGTILTLMAADEYFALHEQIDTIFYQLGLVTGELPLGGYAWPWTIIGGLSVLTVGIPLAIYMYRIFSGSRLLRLLYLLLFFAGSVFVLGAIGLEDLDYYQYAFHGSAGTNIIMGLEESLEMAAVSLVVFVFVRYREERLRPRR